MGFSVAPCFNRCFVMGCLSRMPRRSVELLGMGGTINKSPLNSKPDLFRFFMRRSFTDVKLYKCRISTSVELYVCKIRQM